MGAQARVQGPQEQAPQGQGSPSQPPAGSLRSPLHCAPLHWLSRKCPSPGNPPTTKPYLCHQGLYFHCPPHPRTHALRARGGGLGRPRDTRTHTQQLLPSQRKLGQPRQPGPHRPRGSRPREKNTRRHQDEGPGPGAGVGGAQKPECPPGLGATKRSAATGSGRGGHGPSTHGQSVGPEGADRGLSPPIRIPTPCVSSLGRLPGPEVLAVSTGERQDAHDSGVHKTPSRAWTLGLTSLLGSALPNPRTREPGRVHPALSSAGPVTLPRPLSPLSPAPGASAARPLGHTSWARPPAPSPQVPPWQPPSASAPRRGHSRLPRLPGRWWQGPLPSRRAPLGGPARPGCLDAAATAQAVRVRNPGGARAEHSPTARAATQIPPTVRYK